MGGQKWAARARAASGLFRKTIEKELNMRGRKPKPTEQQVAEGDPRKLGVHRLEQKLKAEAKGSCGLPKCPAPLKGLARKACPVCPPHLSHLTLSLLPHPLLNDDPSL